MILLSSSLGVSHDLRAAAGVGWSRGTSSAHDAAATHSRQLRPAVARPLRLALPHSSRAPTRNVANAAAGESESRVKDRVGLSLQDILVHGFESYKELTVPQLKGLLKQRGLKVSGTKEELMQRLEEAERASSSTSSAAKGRGPKTNPASPSSAGSRTEEVDGVAQLMMKAGVGIPESYVMSKGRQSGRQAPPPKQVPPPSKQAPAAEKPVEPPAEEFPVPPKALELPPQETLETSAPRGGGPVESKRMRAPLKAPPSEAAGLPWQSQEGQPADTAGRPGGRIPSRRGRGSNHVHQGREVNSGGRPWGGRGRGRSGEIGLDSDPGTAPGPLRVPGLVLVEGINDAQAVSRAISANRIVALFEVTKKTGQGKEFREVLQAMADENDKIFVLMDPDNAGNSYRLAIRTQIPQAYHVFIPVQKCVAKTETKHHQIGNVGVEHAEEFDIQAAVLRARVAKLDRQEFSMEELEEWGVAGRHGEGPEDKWQPYGGVRTRRRLFAEALGLHDGSSKSVLNNINHFFTRKEVEEALAALPGPGEVIPEKLTDGLADAMGLGGSNVSGGGGSGDDWPAAFPMYPVKK
eukprot:CAMPEP_0117683622 /NCGR_PEP_ID=MMETSP0804-20121206/20532_1 /TAXON_ID=1074897 /ORGANISM="Tetraselmis astigmatica, Strain CCMP880" /LENGTH=577 /DNA_ID=CAMNT_0005494295 /DNA_START=1 /DNA_END=1734 /DNA_ORIENTATION=+